MKPTLNRFEQVVSANRMGLLFEISKRKDHGAQTASDEELRLQAGGPRTISVFEVGSVTELLGRRQVW